MQTFTPNMESRGAAMDSNVGKHGHHDVIHDVAFDYYGRRMATCSSDHTVRVWDYNDRADKWDVKEFRPHYGPVWRVCWAPPEYGHLLATCSFDRSASIWEEVSTSTGPPVNVESGLKGDNSAKSSGASELMTPDIQQRSVNSDRNVRPSFSAQESASARRTTSTSRPPPLQNLITEKPNKCSTDNQLNKSSNPETGHGRQSMVEGILSKPPNQDSQSSKHDQSTKQIDSARASTGTVGSTPRDGRSRLVTGNGSTDSHGGVTWMRRSFLTDASGSVTDCEFAPRHVGSLQLAICSADGKLRVYESDTQNLQTWQLLCDLDCRIGALSAVSWCPARLSAPMIACGANEDRNVGLTQVDRDRSSSFIGLNQAASSGAPLEHIAVFENVESENGRTSKWKQVVLVNVDALFKRSSAASSQTQSQTRMNLSRVDSSSSGRTAAASKRTDSKSLAAGRFEVGSCHNDSGMARVEAESQAGRSADNYIEPVCSVPVHDLAFAPNFGRAFQLLALATSSGVRIIKMTPLGGANFESIYSLQPTTRPDPSTLLNNANSGNGNLPHRNPEFSSECASMAASTVLHGSENAQLESRLRNLFSDCSLQPLVTEPNQPHSRKASTLSNTGSSLIPLDLFTLATTSADCNAQPNAFGLRTDDATRYACECLLDDAAGKRVWRVAWNVLGSRLAASFDDGHVVLYANDPTTQRWTVTQVVETASTCHASVAVAVADECLAPPLSSSVPNTILHPPSTVGSTPSTVTSHPSTVQQVLQAVYHTAHQLGVPSHPPGMLRVDSFTQALHSEWNMQHTHSARTQTITSSSRNGATSHPYYE